MYFHLYIFYQRYAAEELELEEETDWNVPDHQQLRERDGQQADRAPEDLLKENGQPLTQVGDTTRPGQYLVENLNQI